MSGINSENQSVNSFFIFSRSNTSLLVVTPLITINGPQSETWIIEFSFLSILDKIKSASKFTTPRLEFLLINLIFCF